MNDIQLWSTIGAVLTALGAQHVVTWLVNRGKVRTDDASALRTELRAENKELKTAVDALELRVKELEQELNSFRMLRIDMYRVLQENNVDRNILAQLRILEAGR